MGKVFMNDKDKLLQLADDIASGKEREAKRKVDKTKLSAVSPSKKRNNEGRPKRAKLPSASERLHTAKEIVAARKAKHKREKAKARKAESRAVTQIDSGPSGDKGTDKLSSPPSMVKRKRVLFA